MRVTNDLKRHPTVSAKAIRGFFDEYRWLSNFHQEPDYPILWQGHRYPSVENAYQASKSEDPADWERFAYMTPKGAKSAGDLLELRPNWGEQRMVFMTLFVMQKYRECPRLWWKLDVTKGKTLHETNDWGDLFWGETITGAGRNELGKLTMEIRSMPSPKIFLESSYG